MSFFFYCPGDLRALHSFPTRRSSDLGGPFGAAVFETASGRLVAAGVNSVTRLQNCVLHAEVVAIMLAQHRVRSFRSEEHTSELQSHSDLVCRLLLEKKKNKNKRT